MGGSCPLMHGGGGLRDGFFLFFFGGGGLRRSDICKQTTNFPMEYDKSETCFGIVS